MTTINNIPAVIGPAVPLREAARHPVRYLLPLICFGAAAVLLILSVSQPYWRMTLHAPQYPHGLRVVGYIDHITGDVSELDELNHYIGMKPLNQAARIEKSVGVAALWTFAVVLLMAGTIVHNRWTALLVIPALLFPAIFLLDLHLWLAHFGHNLDPHAPLSSAIKPFTPPVLGEGKIAQFRTVARAQWGLYLATYASACILAGLWFHRAAYKPLVDHAKRRLLRSANPALAMIVLIGLASQASAAQFDLNAAIAGARTGDTVHVPAGVYSGPIVIDQTVTLIGAPGAIIDGHGKGNVVSIKAAGTVLRGLVVRGSGDDLEQDQAGIWVTAPHVTVENNTLTNVLFGVCVHQAAGSVVRGNTITGKLSLEIARRGDGIRLWYSPDCLVNSNEVHDVRDVVIWFSKNVRLTDNHVHASRYGLHFMYCDDNTLIANRLEDNSVGCYLMNSRNLTLHENLLSNNRGPSGYGIGLKDMDGVDARDNRIVGNRIGVYIDTSPQSIGVFDYFTRNILACNDIGVAVLPSVRRNVFQDNSFVDNQEQVAILGSGELRENLFTVNGRGNFWSDYKGFDANGDGIGDLPYKSQSLLENLMDREPKLRFFLYSPAQEALEMASTAFPSVKPRPKFTDDAPLMRPIELHVAASANVLAWQPLAGGVGLLVLGGVPLVGATVRSALGKRKVRQRRLPAVRTDLPVRPLETKTLSPTLLAVSALSKRFGRSQVLDELSFQVSAGEAVALWGGNGAGKTTALRCILGLIRCQGQIKVGDRELRRGGKALRQMIGYVSQEAAFQGDLTALEALRFYARIKGVPAARAEALLADVGLRQHGYKKVANLSGGMRKRLALAAALLSDPPLLILDEIAANLDTEGRHSFLALLGHLKRQGKTILFTSHRLAEVQTLADRVLVLGGGKLLHDCPPDQLGPILGLRSEIRLAVPDDQIEPALGILRTCGFSADRFVRGIRVCLEAGRKAEAIHALLGHEIVVRDFEVETQDTERRHD
jgi:nitrous oxidase accessory protein